MKRTITNKLTMYKTVDEYLATHNSVWSGMLPFANSMLQFRDRLVRIDVAGQKQETPLSGATGDKVAARDGLEDVLFLMCEALGVLAYGGNDRDVEALVDVTRSSLSRLNDEELAFRAANVLAKANALKAELATMQVTQENLDELAEALQDFKSVKAKPRSAVVERSVHTESLSSLMREAGNILRDQIDRAVNLFRRSHPEFVAGYRSARVIVDRTGRRSQQSAVVTPPQPSA